MSTSPNTFSNVSFVSEEMSQITDGDLSTTSKPISITNLEMEFCEDTDMSDSDEEEIIHENIIEA